MEDFSRELKVLEEYGRKKEIIENPDYYLTDDKIIWFETVITTDHVVGTTE